MFPISGTCRYADDRNRERLFAPDAQFLVLDGQVLAFDAVDGAVARQVRLDVGRAGCRQVDFGDFALLGELEHAVRADDEALVREQLSDFRLGVCHVYFSFLTTLVISPGRPVPTGTGWLSMTFST